MTAFAVWAASYRGRLFWPAVLTVMALLIGGAPASAMPMLSNTIGVGEDPFAVVLAPDGSRAYVANSGNGTVSVIEVATSTVISTYALGGAPSGMAISGDGKRLYVGSLYANSVLVVNTEDGAVTDTIHLMGGPMKLAMSPDGTTVYASMPVSNRVAVIDTASKSVTANYKAGMLPYGLMVSRDGTRLYVTEFMSVKVLNTATGALVKTITVGQFPSNFALSADGSALYVTNYTSSTVSVISTGSNTVSGSFPVPGGPWAAGLSPDGSSLFVAARDAGNLVQVDSATQLTQASVAVQDQPFDVVVTPDATRVFVVNAKSDSVSVVGLRPTAPRDVTATTADAALAVSWRAPQFTAGTAIDTYVATASPGGQRCTTSQTTCTIPGLRNGTPYTVTVTAANAVGTSVASAPSAPATPVGMPGPPTAVSAAADFTQAVVRWSAPGADGGAPVTSYTATVTPGGGSCTTSTTSCAISGLVPGTRYEVSVTATNGFATSVPSETASFATRAKLVQKPRDVRGRPPQRIKLAGLTVLTGRNAVTNAGLPIRTVVRARPMGVSVQGEVRYFTVVRGKQGKVSIRTFGYPRLKVVLVQQAPPTVMYLPMRQRTVYVSGRRR